MTFSLAVRTLASALSWGMSTTPAALVSSRSCGTAPSTSTLPCAGRTRPASVHSRVVFPAPDGPVTATIRPGRACRSTPIEHLVAVVVDVHVARRRSRSSSGIAPRLPRSVRLSVRSSRTASSSTIVTRSSEPGGTRSSTSGGSVSEPSRATTAKSSPRRPSAPTRPSRIVTVRGSRCATSGSCVTATTVVPRSRLMSLTAASTSSRPSWSSWLVGSSSSSSPGRAASPTPTASRWRCPGERAVSEVCAWSPRPTRSSTSSGSSSRPASISSSLPRPSLRAPRWANRTLSIGVA